MTTGTISWLAGQGGVGVETVRYYQRRRLLPEPQRPLGGFRHYGPADVTRLQFIRRAQAMGFTLDEIAGLLELKGKRACEQTRRLTELKLVDVRERLDALHRLEVDLMNLIAECSQAPGGESCPTLDRLEHATEHSDKRGRCAAIAD